MRHGHGLLWDRLGWDRLGPQQPDSRQGAALGRPETTPYAAACRGSAARHFVTVVHTSHRYSSRAEGARSLAPGANTCWCGLPQVSVVGCAVFSRGERVGAGVFAWRARSWFFLLAALARRAGGCAPRGLGGESTRSVCSPRAPVHMCTHAAGLSHPICALLGAPAGLSATELGGSGRSCMPRGSGTAGRRDFVGPGVDHTLLVLRCRLACVVACGGPGVGRGCGWPWAWDAPVLHIEFCCFSCLGVSAVSALWSGPKLPVSPTTPVLPRSAASRRLGLERVGGKDTGPGS